MELRIAEATNYLYSHVHSINSIDKNSPNISFVLESVESLFGGQFFSRYRFGISFRHLFFLLRFDCLIVAIEIQ